MSADDQLGDIVLAHASVGSLPYTLVVNSRPTIKGQLTFKFQNSISTSDLSIRDFTGVWLTVKEWVSCINNQSGKKIRYATGTDGGNWIHLFPLQDSSEPWQPIIFGEPSFTNRYPGYVKTQSGPEVDKSMLEEIQRRITRVTGWTTPSYVYPDRSDTNLFARLVRGEIPQWRIWEDNQYIAFLTPFPNTPGLSVVIPRLHLSSDIFSLGFRDFIPFVQAAHHVSRMLTKALEIERVGMFFEGFEIDYAHIKLVPVLKEVDETGESVGTFYEKYPGCLTTQPGPEKTAEELKVQVIEGLEDCIVKIEETLQKYVK
jgi:L-asparaginase / beta-aspartyl-peptidase